MIRRSLYEYQPEEFELERASNVYLMSLVAIVIGLPFPIINLLATFGFYLLNRKGTHFVRWHCTQALLSQLLLAIVNAIAMYWTFSILFGPYTVGSEYLSYCMTVVLLNILEFIITIATAIYVRKGVHIRWLYFSAQTDLIVRK